MIWLYIMQVTLTALGEMFEAARGIMAWLSECAKVTFFYKKNDIFLFAVSALPFMISDMRHSCEDNCIAK